MAILCMAAILASIFKNNISRRCLWSRGDIVENKIVLSATFFAWRPFLNKTLTKMFVKSGRYCRKICVLNYENLIFYQRRFLRGSHIGGHLEKTRRRGRSRDRAHIAPRKPRETLLPFRIRRTHTHTHTHTTTHIHTQKQRTQKWLQNLSPINQ